MKKMMKTTLFALATAFAAVATSYAGPMKSMPMKQVEVMPPPQPALCFEANELSLDAFSGAVIADGEGFAIGGIGINYFPTPYVGVGVDGYWFNEGDTTIHNVTGSLIFRLPLQEACLAPYAYVGGGVHANSDTDGSVHVGGGIEWKALESVGLFADGRYTFVERQDFDSDGFTLIKAGLRFYF